MILEEFFNESRDRYCYLVSSNSAAEAALVDPVQEDIDLYLARISERNLKLAYVLQTHGDPGTANAAERLRREAGSRWVAPRDAAAPQADIRVGHGDSLMLGNLTVRVGQCANTAAGSASYRVGDCFFRGEDVVVAGGGVVRIPSHSAPAAAPPAHECRSVDATRAAEPGPNEQAEAHETEQPPRRLSPRELAERVADEARRSLESLQFTPKEARVLEAYLALVASGRGEYPSALELAEHLGNITKRDLHVQIHNIRRKQVDGGCLPVVLAGQITKWLKKVQDEPEYTPHEREFLTAYLSLCRSLSRPPTGDEVLRALAGRRSLQWVRKRVQTIRAKQSGYDKQPLLMSRRGGGISRARTSG